jgi:aspartate/methionine/tyrosine aminotransferase
MTTHPSSSAPAAASASTSASAAAPSRVAERLRPFGTTIFATISRLAAQHGAVNLGQGFPDFDGPLFLKEAARDAMLREHNQYAPMPGVPALRQQIAARFTRDTGLPCDPDAHVTVTAGCTEAIAAALLGLCNPGDEVVLIQPFYDSYRACVTMAGATARYATLRPGADGFTLDERELRAAFSSRTRAIIVNTPHNPTGKVFTRDELAMIARLAIEHDSVVISDEVYERLLIDERAAHVSIATLPGMSERTIVLSSLGKTFSMTGWKIGWSVAPAPLTAAVRAAHQFLTFAIATPLQHAAAEALRREHDYAPEIVALLRANAKLLGDGLEALELRVHRPHAGYFVMAEHAPLSRRLGTADDQATAVALIERVGVATIPPSVFYDNPDAGSGRAMLRLAFCKKPETVSQGLERLSAFAGMVTKSE